MSGVDSLPPDQRAVLQLVLQQGRTYEDLAGMLGIDTAGVRARAHAAAESLAGAGASLGPGERAEITDFLLGQQTVSQREATRGHLSGSESARDWARGLASELRALGGDGLPEIPPAVRAERVGPAWDDADDDDDLEPDDEPRPAPARRRAERAERSLPAGTAARSRRPASASAAPTVAAPPPPAPGARRSSRLGGAILLGGIVVAGVVLAIILIGGGDDNKSTPAASTSTPTQTSTTQPTPEAQVNLRAAQPGSKALGIAQIVNQGGERAMALVGQNIPASPQGYAVWLYNSAQAAVRLGYTQPVEKNGRLSALAPLPKNASKYKELVISRETTRNPRTPTTIVLRGTLKLSS